MCVDRFGKERWEMVADIGIELSARIDLLHLGKTCRNTFPLPPLTDRSIVQGDSHGQELPTQVVGDDLWIFHCANKLADHQNNSPSLPIVSFTW
jgi:hypothetical protein